MKKDQTFHIYYLILSLVIATAGILYYTNPLQKVGDEYVHYDQIERYAQGDTSINPLLPMAPVYHQLIYFFSAHSVSLQTVRLISAYLSLLLVIPAYYFLSTKLKSTGHPALRTLQFYLIPAFFSMYYLVYTDFVSLGLLLVGYWLLKEERWFISASFLTVAMYMRQTNIFFALMFFIDSLVSKNPITFKWAKHHGWLLLGIFSACVFMVQNGIVYGDKGAHPLGFHFGNIFFFLFIIAIYFMPILIWKIDRVAREIRLVPYLPFIFCIFAIALFSVSNPYNEYTFIWFNLVLHYITTSILVKAIFILICCYSIYALAATEYTKFNRPLLIVICGIALSMSALIEPRYYLVPIALFNLYRKDEPLWLEKTQTIYLGILSALFILMV